MFEVNEFLTPFTWSNYINGGMSSIRPGQRCSKEAVEFQQSVTDVTPLSGQQLMGLGVQCRRTDTGICWNTPITDQNGKRGFPVFGKIDGTEQSDYVLLALLPDLPPQA